MNLIKNTKSLSFATLLVGLGLSACADQGPTAGVAVQALSSQTSAPSTPLELVDEAGGSFAVSAATLSLRHIELDLPDGNSCGEVEGDLSEEVSCDQNTIKIDGPFVVNLATGTSAPSLADVVIPAGTYKRIDFRVADDQSDESFAVTANFDLNGEAHTLELSLDFNEDIRIESSAGITVGADEDLIGTFVASSWLAGIDIASCVENGDVDVSGTTVKINAGSSGGSCSDIENRIKENMKNSGQLDRR